MRLILLSCLFFAACSSGDKKDDEKTSTAEKETKPAGLTAYKNIFDGELKSWAASFVNFDLTDFEPSDTAKFENADAGEMGDLKELVKIYKPLLYYSADSSAFIDMYSAQLSLQVINGQYYSEGDVDQAIYLCRPATSTWKRLLFYGPSAGMEEAAWLSDSSFIMGGIFFNDEGKRVPIVVVGNEATQTLYHFSNKDTACVQGDERYSSERLKKLNIKEMEY